MYDNLLGGSLHSSLKELPEKMHLPKRCASRLLKRRDAALARACATPMNPWTVRATRRMTAGRARCFGRRRTSRRRESTTRSARQNRRSSRAPRPPRLFGHHGNALHPREGAQARVLRLRALLEPCRRARPRTGASTSADAPRMRARSPGDAKP